MSGALQRGDLLFFDTNEIFAGVVTHVGIYEGNNLMVNAIWYSCDDDPDVPDCRAGHAIDRVDITGRYWAPRFLFARRLIGATTFTDPAQFQAALDQAGLRQTTITFDDLPPETPIGSGATVNGVAYTFNVAGGHGGLATALYLAVTFPNTLRVARSTVTPASANFFFPGDAVTVSFAQPIRAIGAYFSSNPAAGAAQAFISIATPVGNALSGTALPGGTFGFPTNSLRFVGLVSQTPFNQATLAITRPSPGGVGFVADNLIVGR